MTKVTFSLQRQQLVLEPQYGMTALGHNQTVKTQINLHSR